MTMILVLFSDQVNRFSWIPVNDVVMGGYSESELKIEAGLARFTGTVSLENNGGFASVRSELLDLDLQNYSGIVIGARGDGKQYKFTIRTSGSFDGIAYQAKFNTQDGIWLDYTLPFSSFIPTFRGKILKSAEPLNTAKISSFGFMISEKQSGPFSLSIHSVSTYS